jgi:hypothetical protein
MKSTAIGGESIYALLLPAGQLRGQWFSFAVHIGQFQKFLRACVALFLVKAAHFQGEGNIVQDGEMREQFAPVSNLAPEQLEHDLIV